MFINKMKSLVPSRRGASKKLKGILTSYNPKKGCGFIQSQSSSEKVFVLFTELNDRIKRGDRVRFDLYASPLGLKARNVELEKA